MAKDKLIITCFLIGWVWSLIDINYNLSFEHYFIYALLCLVFSLIFKISNSKKREVKDVYLQANLKCIELKTVSTFTNDIHDGGDTAKTNAEILGCNTNDFKNFESDYLFSARFLIDNKDIRRSYSDTCVRENDVIMSLVQTSNASKSDDTSIEQTIVDTPPNLFSELPEIDRAWFEVEEQELIDIFDNPCTNNNHRDSNNPFKNSSDLQVNPNELSYEFETPLENLEKYRINNDNSSPPVQTPNSLKSNSITMEQTKIETNPDMFNDLPEIDKAWFEVDEQELIDIFGNPFFNDNPFANNSFKNPSDLIVHTNELSYEVKTPLEKSEKDHINNDETLSPVQSPNASDNTFMEEIYIQSPPIVFSELQGIDNPMFDFEKEEQFHSFEKSCINNNHFAEEDLISSFKDSTLLLDDRIGKRQGKFRSNGRFWKNISYSLTLQKYTEMKHRIQQKSKKMRNLFKKY